MRDVSFDLYPGEALGVIGENGAGKSTLLKLITGTQRYTEGSIHIAGRIGAILELGMGFNPDLTGRQNVYHAAGLMGLSHEEITRAIPEIEDFAEIGGYFDEPVRIYSSGMQMRLAFSVATAFQPDILIVDEALSVGDAYFQHKCISRIKAFKERGVSLLFVSHDMNAVKVLCDRAILLSGGRVIEMGEPHGVVNKYNFMMSKTEDMQYKVGTEPKDTSYGTFDAEITALTIKGKTSDSDIITSGDDTVIELLIRANRDVKDVTVGIQIKDRFGQVIFGTNTFFYDMKLDLVTGKTYRCVFRLRMDIGWGEYMISAALHSGENHLQRCYYWHDGIVTFKVAGYLGRYSIGICKLYPEIEFCQLDDEADNELATSCKKEQRWQRGL